FPSENQHDGSASQEQYLPRRPAQGPVQLERVGLGSAVTLWLTGVRSIGPASCWPYEPDPVRRVVNPARNPSVPGGGSACPALNRRSRCRSSWLKTARMMRT